MTIHRQQDSERVQRGGAGVSPVTFHKWHAKYGSIDVPIMPRMKELEEENARPRKMDEEEEVRAEAREEKS